MAVGGAHRIAVDAARRDLLAPAPFDGVVDADDDRPSWQQPFEDQGQQLAGDDPAVPVRLAEHMVIEREISGFGQPHDAQHGAHGALAGGEDGARHQHQDVVPDRRGEAVSENRHQRNDGRRHDCGSGGRGRRIGRAMMVCHRICRIESGESPFDVTPAGAASR
jgi:hypothetical protein